MVIPMTNKLNRKVQTKIKRDLHISVEDEFIRKPVGPRKPKEKKSDLTDELNKFISNPITLQTIAEILIRLQGRWISEKPGEYKIKIYGLQGFGDEYDEFFIIIKKVKHFPLKYYLTSASLYELTWLNGKDMDTSHLKQNMRCNIFKWLCKNLDQTIKIE